MLTTLDRAILGSFDILPFSLSCSHVHDNVDLSTRLAETEDMKRDTQPQSLAKSLQEFICGTIR